MTAKHMHSIAILTLGEVLPHIGPDSKIEVQGRMINASSLRLHTFKVKGCDCATCDVKAAFFSVETLTRFNKETNVRRPVENSYHLNLYGRRADGTLVLMTHDHVWPRVEGGYDTIKNSVPMCARCNQNKGRKLPSAEFIAKWGCAYDPDYVKRSTTTSANSNNPPKKIRTPEEIAEKQRRRAEWEATHTPKPIRAKA